MLAYEFNLLMSRERPIASSPCSVIIISVIFSWSSELISQCFKCFDQTKGAEAQWWDFLHMHMATWGQLSYNLPLCTQIFCQIIFIFLTWNCKHL